MVRMRAARLWLAVWITRSQSRAGTASLAAATIIRPTVQKLPWSEAASTRPMADSQPLAAAAAIKPPGHPLLFPAANQTSPQEVGASPLEHKRKPYIKAHSFGAIRSATHLLPPP